MDLAVLLSVAAVVAAGVVTNLAVAVGVCDTWECDGRNVCCSSDGGGSCCSSSEWKVGFSRFDGANIDEKLEKFELLQLLVVPPTNEFGSIQRSIFPLATSLRVESVPHRPRICNVSAHFSNCGRPACDTFT